MCPSGLVVFTCTWVVVAGGWRARGGRWGSCGSLCSRSLVFSQPVLLICLCLCLCVCLCVCLCRSKQQQIPYQAVRQREALITAFEALQFSHLSREHHLRDLINRYEAGWLNERLALPWMCVPERWCVCVCVCVWYVCVGV